MPTTQKRQLVQPRTQRIQQVRLVPPIRQDDIRLPLWLVVCKIMVSMMARELLVLVRSLQEFTRKTTKKLEQRMKTLLY